MRRTPSRYAWSALTAAALAAAAPARGALEAEVTAAVNAAHDRTTSPAGRLEASRVDVRPGAMLQLSTPRLVWRAAYLFSGTRTVEGEGEDAYSNALHLSLAALPSGRSNLTLSAGATQGTTSFRLSERSAAEGAPALRARDDLSLVTATLGEIFAWELSERLRLEQGLEAAATASQDALDRRNLVAGLSLRVDRLYPRDALGLVAGARHGALRPLVGEEGETSRTTTSSLVASWNHDFDPRWNAQALAGVEHVNRLGGDSPGRIHPTGAVTVRYYRGAVDAALAYRRGATANLETGTMSLSDEVVLRALLDVGEVRQLSASVGFVRSRLLADVPSVAADAANGDLGLVWSLSEGWMATARYSVAYQLGDAVVPGTSWFHVALVGVTARWGTAPYVAPVPTLGEGRVDRGDAAGFPGEERDAGAPAER